jgi:hypothetical protein
MNRVVKKRGAAPLAPLPPAGETIVVLERLADHQYETRARTRAALKLAHHALAEALRWIDAFAREEALIPAATAAFLHKKIRDAMALDKPKRFPPLPVRAPLPVARKNE